MEQQKQSNPAGSFVQARAGVTETVTGPLGRRFIFVTECPAKEHDPAMFRVDRMAEYRLYPRTIRQRCGLENLAQILLMARTE